MAVSGRAIGVDFGTSTSFVAEGDVARGVTLAPLGRTTTFMPSLLGVTSTQLLAGDNASDLPERQIVRSIKRCITQRRGTLPHPTDPDQVVRVDSGIVTILRQLASSAEDSGVTFDAQTLRLGCPAMWDSEQRTRLLKLAQDAGIPVREHTLIDEPIAAGMAWLSHISREHRNEVRGRLLVFDMGGGTLDVALLQVDSTSGDNSGEISVLSSKGVDEAGDALDIAIWRDLKEMLDVYDLGLTERDSAELDRKLLPEARQAKVLLTSEDHALIQLFLGDRRLPTLTYSREQLESSFAGQLDAAESLVWHVVRESFLTHEAHRSPQALRAIPNEVVARGVDHVLLAGGMSQIPVVRQRLERMFPHAEVHSRAGRRLSPDEAIVAGLAETTVYDRVNLHRPPFDFLLELPDTSSRMLYEAHSPLYAGWQAQQRDELYYEIRLPARDLPPHGQARLRARSAMGSELRFRVDLALSDGIEVPLGRKDILFRIRPNGRISIMDGRGRPHAFRVNRWPVLRGKDHAVIQLERWETTQVRRRSRSWDKDALFNH